MSNRRRPAPPTTRVLPRDTSLVSCPVCAAPSRYDVGWDRYFHAYGSDNQQCWLALLRGDRLVPAS
jgi:hypothetical protein